MSHGKFVTAVNCMDGRVQLPVIAWMKKEFGVDFVDMVTEPGPIKCLAENADISAAASIQKRIQVSVEKHGSGVIAIIGHFDCAGNPLQKVEQVRQIKKSIAVVESWGFPAAVVGLWVDENWRVEKLSF